MGCRRRYFGPVEESRWVVNEHDKSVPLRYVIPVVCRKTNGEVNISHENSTMIVWIYDGV